MQKHQKILIFANILRVNLSYLSNYYWYMASYLLYIHYIMFPICLLQYLLREGMTLYGILPLEWGTVICVSDHYKIVWLQWNEGILYVFIYSHVGRIMVCVLLVYWYACKCCPAWRRILYRKCVNCCFCGWWCRHPENVKRWKIKKTASDLTAPWRYVTYVSRLNLKTVKVPNIIICRFIFLRSYIHII